MKNKAVKFSSAVIVLFMLILLVCTGYLLCAPHSVASADSTMSVIKAPVSNLEGNAYAGKSTLKLIPLDGNKAIFVPESYFVEYKKPYAGELHEVVYAGKLYYVKGASDPNSITVADDELIYPDVALTIKEGETVTIKGGMLEITNEYVIKFLGYGEDGTEIFVSMVHDGNSPITDFIPVDKFNAFTIPYQHKTQVERDELLASKVEPPVFGNDGTITPKTSVALRVIIIIGIAIPTVLIVLLLFKPSKNERRYAKNSVRSERGKDDFDYDDSRSYRRRDDRRDDRRNDIRDDRRDDIRDNRYDGRYDRDYRDDRDYDRDERGYDRRD